LELANSLSGEEKKGLVMLSGLRRLHFSLQFADANTIFTPELFPELYAAGQPHSFKELRELFVGPMSAVLTNEELPSQFLELYETCLKLLSGLDSVRVALGSNVFSLQLEGFPIFEGYLPTVEAMRQIKIANTPPVGLENISVTLESDGGEVEGYNAVFATIDASVLVYCTNMKEKNVNLIFSPSTEQEYAVAAVFIRNPESGFTSALKDALVWVLPEKPDFAHFDKYNDFTKEQFEKDTSDTKPLAFIEVPANGGVQVSLEKWAKGKYFFIKMLNSHGSGNIDVEFFGFAGFASSTAPAEFQVINPAQKLGISGIPASSLTDCGLNF